MAILAIPHHCSSGSEESPHPLGNPGQPGHPFLTQGPNLYITTGPGRDTSVLGQMCLARGLASGAYKAHPGWMGHGMEWVMLPWPHLALTAPRPGFSIVSRTGLDPSQLRVHSRFLPVAKSDIFQRSEWPDGTGDGRMGRYDMVPWNRVCAVGRVVSCNATIQLQLSSYVILP